MTACSVLTATLLRRPLSMSFIVLQKTYGNIEIVLPEGKMHRTGIWEIPLVRVERYWTNGVV